MRRLLLVPALVASVAAASSVAFAEENANGTIKAVDMKAMTITLADGKVYHLPKGFKDPGLKAGEKVQVSWNMQNGKYEATSVTIEK